VPSRVKVPAMNGGMVPHRLGGLLSCSLRLLSGSVFLFAGMSTREPRLIRSDGRSVWDASARLRNGVRLWISLG
jgi:hypothetical protein